MSGVDENKKVPAIRFEGFGGEWEVVQLGEIVNQIIDNRGKNPKYYCRIGIPVIDNYMIKNNLYPNLIDANRFIDELLFESFIRTYNELDDVLITLVGNGIGNITLFPKEKSVIIQNTLGLRFLDNKKFMFYSLLSENKTIVLLNRGMAQPSIRQDELLEINIARPFAKKEQTKIGNYFQQLDTLIAQHQQKHDKLQNLKKALLEKCFPKQGEHTPELRFKGFSGAWEEKALGDVVNDLYNGQTPSRMVDDYWNGDISWLSSGELNRGVVKQTIEKITTAGKKNANLQIVPKGTFVMAITGLEAVGTRGNCAILDIDTTLNQSCMAVLANPKLLDTVFLFQWYRLHSEEYGQTYTQGTKQQSYNAKIVRSLKFICPLLLEQIKIGNLFQQLDTLINQQQTQLGKLKNIKQACLEKMFV